MKINMKINNIENFDIPVNPYMENMISEIAEKQSKMFDKKAIGVLNIEALSGLFNLCLDELRERGIENIRGINIK